MKRILALLITLLGVLSLPDFALAQLSQLQRAELRDSNLLGPWNPGFESGKQGWTNAGATFATTTATVLDGTTSASWTPTAAAQTLDSKPVVVPAGLLGAQCQAQLLYKGGDGSTTFQVFDQTTAAVIGGASQVLSAASTPVTVVLPFNCPSAADTIKLRLTSSAAGAAVILDKAFLGLAAQNGIVSISPIVFTQAKTAVGSVGSSGQIAAGHALTTTEWPFATAGKLAYYNLSASATADGSGALSCASGTTTCTLTNNGTVALTGIGILGAANSAASFNGTSQYLSSADTFFSPTTTATTFLAGGWFTNTNWATANNQTPLSKYVAATTRLFQIITSGSGEIDFLISDAADDTNNASLNFPGIASGFANNSWHHLAIGWDGVYAKAYIDGKVVGRTPLANVSTSSAPFQIGARNGSLFWTGLAEEVFFLKAYSFTDDDVRKLYAYSWSHNKNIPTSNQWLTGNWYRTDSNIANQLTSAWVVNKGANTLYTDFSDIASGAFVDFNMANASTSAISIPTNSYDSGWLSATPPTTIPHGLGAVPSAMQIQYQSGIPSAGNYQLLSAGDYCSFDSVNFYCDWTGLTVGPSNQVRIQSWQSGAATAAAAASSTSSGVVNTSAQTFAGTKSFSNVVVNSGGSLASDTITNSAGSGAPNFPFGASGITASVNGTPEKNYLTTAGTYTATGWTASGAGVTVTTTSTTADLPRPNTDTTGIKFTGVSGSTAYAYYRFTLDPADYGKKLKVKFDQNATAGVASTYANGDFKVDVYQNTLSNYTGTSTRLSLSTDSSSISSLPNLTGTYQTTFDSGNATAPYIELRIGLNATNTHSIVLSDVIVGPGIIGQGAIVGPWLAYTPSIGGIPASQISGSYRRVGDTLEIVNTFTATGAATAAITESIPSGFTINNGAIPGGLLGTAQATKSAVGYTIGSALSNGAGSTIVFNSASGGLNWGPTVPFTWANNDNLQMHVSVPVNELSGSGVVNLAQNDVEYAYNTSTSDAPDTTSFGYGPSGSTFPGTLTTSRFKRVRFRSPIQATDQLILEIQASSGGFWIPASTGDANSAVVPFHYEGSGAASATYGIGVNTGSINGTDVDVTFGHFQWNNSTYAASGSNWATTNGNWRLKKFSGASVAGFQNYNPGISAGLVPSAGLPGSTTGNPACTGCVGEVIQANLLRSSGQSLTSTVVKDVTGIFLTNGAWLIGGSVGYNMTNGTTSTLMGCYISIGAANTGPSANASAHSSLTSENSNQISGTLNAVSGGADNTCTIPPYLVYVTTGPQQFRLGGQMFFSGTVTQYGSVQAVRVF